MGNIKFLKSFEDLIPVEKSRHPKREWDDVRPEETKVDHSFKPTPPKYEYKSVSRTGRVYVDPKDRAEHYRVNKLLKETTKSDIEKTDEERQRGNEKHGSDVVIKHKDVSHLKSFEDILKATSTEPSRHKDDVEDMVNRAAEKTERAIIRHKKLGLIPNAKQISKTKYSHEREDDTQEHRDKIAIGKEEELKRQKEEDFRSGKDDEDVERSSEAEARRTDGHYGSEFARPSGISHLKSFNDLINFTKTTEDQAKHAKDEMYSPEKLKEWHSSNNMDGVHTFPPRHVYKTEEGEIRAKDKKEKVKKILDEGIEKKSSEGDNYASLHYDRFKQKIHEGLTRELKELGPEKWKEKWGKYLDKNTESPKEKIESTRIEDHDF